MDTIYVAKSNNLLLVELSEYIPNPVREWMRLISKLTRWNHKTRRYEYQIPSVFETAIIAFADYHNICLVSKVKPEKPVPTSRKEETYEQYQLRWMSEHGHSLNSLMYELAEMQYEDPEDSDRISTPVTELFSEWEQDRGFGGSIWACKEEWEDCENSAYPELNHRVSVTKEE